MPLFAASRKGSPPRSPMPRQVQCYVTELLEAILGLAEIEKRFDWCRGDTRRDGGRGRTLPFDAVWESRKLIVEIDEKQHGGAVAIFDKPGQLTVSGVHRGEQRRRYDERKAALAASHGYRLVRVNVSMFGRSARRLLHKDAGDADLVREFLRNQGLTELPLESRTNGARVDSSIPTKRPSPLGAE